MRERARVISWKAEARFGFLDAGDPTKKDIFVHRSDLIGREKLVPGELVEYTPSVNKVGKIATEVIVIEAAPHAPSPKPSPKPEALVKLLTELEVPSDVAASVIKTVASATINREEHNEYPTNSTER